jgi:hypothetical protein
LVAERTKFYITSILALFYINQGQANQARPPRQAVMASNMPCIAKEHTGSGPTRKNSKNRVPAVGIRWQRLPCFRPPLKVTSKFHFDDRSQEVYWIPSYWISITHSPMKNYDQSLWNNEEDHSLAATTQSALGTLCRVI